MQSIKFKSQFTNYSAFKILSIQAKNPHICNTETVDFLSDLPSPWLPDELHRFIHRTFPPATTVFDTHFFELHARFSNVHWNYRHCQWIRAQLRDLQVEKIKIKNKSLSQLSEWRTHDLAWHQSWSKLKILISSWLISWEMRIISNAEAKLSGFSLTFSPPKHLNNGRQKNSRNLLCNLTERTYWSFRLGGLRNWVQFLALSHLPNTSATVKKK